MSEYKRVTISVSPKDMDRIEELKKILRQRTASKVIQQLIRYGKL